MSLVAFDGAGGWLPLWPFVVPAFSSAGSVYLIDADGEYIAMILQCPKAGTIDRFSFNIGTVTNSPDNGLRASFQGVNASGLPDGTILGATNNAFVTYAHTVTTGWKTTNFGETATVTRGQKIAMVVDIPTFTAGDSVHLSHAILGSYGLPYGVSITGTKQTGTVPIMALHYTDGYVHLSPAVIPITAFTNTGNFNVDTAVADEWGLAFQVPVACRLEAVALGMTVAATADYEIVLYNAADSVVTSATMDGDIKGDATNPFQTVIWLDAATDLTPDATYRVTLRPTTTANVSLQYFGFPSLEVMDTHEGGSNWHMTSRVNQGGSWTNYNNSTDGFRRPKMSLYLSSFDKSAAQLINAGALIG